MPGIQEASRFLSSIVSFLTKLKVTSQQFAFVPRPLVASLLGLHDSWRRINTHSKYIQLYNLMRRKFLGRKKIALHTEGSRCYQGLALLCTPMPLRVPTSRPSLPVPGSHHPSIWKLFIPPHSLPVNKSPLTVILNVSPWRLKTIFIDLVLSESQAQTLKCGLIPFIYFQKAQR